MRGWFRLYRDITEHWIYQDAEYLKVWIEMLVRARHSEEASTELIEGQLVTIQQGEFIFGRPGWAKRLGVSEQKLRTLLKKLINDEMIELTSRFNKFSLYRVKNYQNYNQQNNQQDNQHINQQKTASPLGEMSLDNQQNNQQDNQQINLQSTSSQPANNQQLTTKEECKERKNVKNDKNKKIKYGDYVSMTETEYNKLVEEHGEEKTKRMIEVLDNYKGSKGKTYKSDYRAILNWVVTRVNEEASKRGGYRQSNRFSKPAIPVVDSKPTSGGLAPEELERARELARRLDANRSDR